MAHFKVHDQLSGPELEELHGFAREPGRTVDEIHQWLQERGFTMSRSAAGRWKQQFDEEVMRERFSRSGELARAIKDAAQGGQFESVAEAAVMQLTQVVFEQASRLESEGQLDPLDVQRMTRSIVNLVGSKAGLIKIYAERFEREMQKTAAEGQAKKAEEIFTPERIADARRRIFGC